MRDELTDGMFVSHNNFNYEFKLRFNNQTKIQNIAEKWERITTTKYKYIWIYSKYSSISNSNTYVINEKIYAKGLIDKYVCIFNVK